jgi:UDP-GlcNAc3NAcA epimerase
VKIISVVGARPQFIKASAVSKVLRQEHHEVMVHTGQHYDDNMSSVFFDEMGIPAPDYNLDVGSGRQGEQTGCMLARIEDVLLAEMPDRVLVYGDTNSTLAGALAAAKLCVPVAHVEAGLRSFNRAMPEEINRMVADRLSDLLFCPSRTAVENLACEGIIKGVHEVGDVMFDALMSFADLARARSVCKNLGIREGKYILATIHRAENADDPVRLQAILAAFERIPEKIVFPAHPRTRNAMAATGYTPTPNVLLIDAVGYLDMLHLVQGARLILTDSGGLQKEAYWLSVPCVTLRNETEWVEIPETGWNVLVGANTVRIVEAVATLAPPGAHPSLYGTGDTAKRIVAMLSSTSSSG